MTTTALEIPSLKEKVSPEEWAVRVDLAAASRGSLFGTMASGKTRFGSDFLAKSAAQSL